MDDTYEEVEARAGTSAEREKSILDNTDNAAILYLESDFYLPGPLAYHPIPYSCPFRES